jgi:hypothetical protein
MKIRKLQIAIMAATLVMAVQARATLYDISFIDLGGANAAIGQIDVVGGVAISGYLNVQAGVAQSPPLWLQQPGTGSDGSFFWDNAVDPTGGFPNGTFVNNAGLLFAGLGVHAGTELNLYANGNPVVDRYTLEGNIGGNWNPIAVGDAAIFLAPVPEPTTMIAGALLLLPFGASTLRILRKRTA